MNAIIYNRFTMQTTFILKILFKLDVNVVGQGLKVPLKSVLMSSPLCFQVLLALGTRGGS